MVIVWSGPRIAHGQEIVLAGPVAPPPPTYWVGAVPAELEWTYFVTGGVANIESASDSEWSAVGAVGGELTFELARYHGFPSGWYHREKGDAEIRVGPWASAGTRASGGLVELGLKLHFGGIYHASFGTWDVRLGGGYGAYARERAPHVTATFAYGVRGVLARYPERPYAFKSEIPPEPKLLAEATVARLFVTFRRAFDLEESRELWFGVELSPTFLLPPHSLMRFAGGHPW